MLNKTYNPRINTSTDFMKSSLHSLSVKITLILLFLLLPFFTQAQELTDQQIGFDPTRITQSLKERGITDPAMLDQEITIMRESQKHIYQEQKKIQEEILAKIEKEQKKNVSNRLAVTDIPQEERDALIALYNSTDGPNWTNTKANNKPWKIDDPTSDVSTWYGVYTFNGHVVSINLCINVNGNNLNGSLTDLSPLTELSYLCLGSPNSYYSSRLSGDINYISKNYKLQNLQLQSGLLTGNLESLINLKELMYITIYGNISGQIPLGIQNLTKLENLNLITKVNGGFENLGNLSTLKSMTLQYNDILSKPNNNVIPYSFSNLQNLYHLALTSYRFNTNLDVISSLTNLTNLQLIDNDLSNTLPPSFLNLNKLTSVDFSYNPNLKNIESLSNSDMYYLRILGSGLEAFPPVIEKFKNIYSIFLENNVIEGNIPIYLKNRTNLKSNINLLNNKLRFIDFLQIDQGLTLFESLNAIAPFPYSVQKKTDARITTTQSENEKVILKMFENGRTHSSDTFQWFKNGIEIPGATSREYTIPSVSLTDAGTYTCKSYHTTNPDMSPLVLEREPITLTVTNCPTVEANIYIGNGGLTCEKGSETPCVYECGDYILDTYLVNLNGADLTGATYAWTVKNPSVGTLFTSNQTNFAYTLNIAGENTIELVLTTANGCKYNFSKKVTVVTCPSLSCTSTSKTTPIVKELFKNLITKLLSLPEGTITEGYTCSELSELAPYITDQNPAIYGYYEDPTTKWIRFNFAPHSVKSINFQDGYDVVLDTGGTQGSQLGAMTDIDVSTYATPTMGLQNIPSFFENGFAKMYVNHVNFCPETIEQTYCINQALSLNFETQDANLNYTWSIIDSANAIIATGTTPTVVFTPTAEGTYKIKLTASSIDKCETTFTKLIFVKNCIPLESCTKNNPNATHIAGLFKNLVNKLITLPTASVPNGFTCPELVELIPYIADTDAKIYNFTNTGNKISFSFDNHDLGDHDVVISYPTGVQISGFNLDAFVNDQTLTKITTNYSNGLSESTQSKVRHINFCANKIISCTESNPRTAKVKELFVKLLNHLKNRIEEGKDIPDGYTCEELRRFKYYTTEPQNVYIYNFNASTFSFSFHSGAESSIDVSIPELMQHPKVTIQSVDLNYYTSANEYTSMDWKITLSSGVKLSKGKVKHVEFCPEEICVQHVAVVVDESGSLDDSEKRKIRNQLLSFVQEQARINDDIGANMHISLIGMSDSDKPSNRRTDHILELKPTATNTQPGGAFYNWITQYGTNYDKKYLGISEGSDFWLSGLEVSLNSSFKVKPSMVIMITDGAQTDNAGALKDFMRNFDNFAGLKDTTKPHLYVIGIKNGHYIYDPTTAGTSTKLSKEEDPNYNPQLDAINTTNARVTSALSLSLKYLLGLEEVNKPLNLDINNFRADYAGLDDFNLFRDDLTYISDKIAKAEINCGEESIKETCDDCFSFQPKPGQVYVLNAWVKEDVTEQQKTYSNPKIKLTFYDGNNTKIGEEIFHTVGNIIDGWQRIGNKFEIPNNDFNPLEQTVFIDFELINESKNVAVFFDDIRIYPVKGSMKTFVYDPENFRLMSELDENNYSTFYEYDNEGGLVRIKKETAQGVKTIQETRSGNVIKND